MNCQLNIPFDCYGIVSAYLDNDSVISLKCTSSFMNKSIHYNELVFKTSEDIRYISIANEPIHTVTLHDMDILHDVSGIKMIHFDRPITNLICHYHKKNAALITGVEVENLYVYYEYGAFHANICCKGIKTLTVVNAYKPGMFYMEHALNITCFDKSLEFVKIDAEYVDWADIMCIYANKIHIHITDNAMKNMECINVYSYITPECNIIVNEDIYPVRIQMFEYHRVEVACPYWEYEGLLASRDDNERLWSCSIMTYMDNAISIYIPIYFVITSDIAKMIEDIKECIR